MATIASGRRDRISVDVTTNKTLTAADCGIIQNVTADGVIITLPATTAGYVFTVRNGGAAPSGAAAGAGADGSALVQVSPASVDYIAGNGFTATDNKDAINTKATSKVGDEITLIADGANGYFIQSLTGTWAREA